MSYSWIILLVCVLYFGFQGYRQGALSALGRILGLVAGYTAAFIFAQPLSEILSERTTIQGFASLIAASIGLFFGASLLVSLVISLLRKLLPIKQQRSPAIKVLGLTTGALVGSVFGLAAVFIVSYFRDVYSTVRPDAAQVESPSRVEQISRRVAGGVASWAAAGLDAEPAVAKMTSLLVTDPAAIVGGMQQVFDSPAAKDLFNNPDNQAVLASNDPEAIAQLPSFQAFADNEQIQQLAEASGIDTSNPSEFNHSLAGQMATLWGRAQTIKDNPEIQAVLRDPEFQKKVQAKNPMALMADARFMKIVSAIMNTDVSQSPIVTQVKSQMEKESESTPEPQVYRWTDEDGNIHFSDRPRDEIPDRTLR
ncbi:CvpA family protein [Aurantivibrio plasticivorans]